MFKNVKIFTCWNSIEVRRNVLTLFCLEYYQPENFKRILLRKLFTVSKISYKFWKIKLNSTIEFTNSVYDVWNFDFRCNTSTLWFGNVHELIESDKGILIVKIGIKSLSYGNMGYQVSKKRQCYSISKIEQWVLWFLAGPGS